MSKRTILLISLIIALLSNFILCQTGLIASYPKGRIIMKENNLILEGKKLVIDSEFATLTVEGKVNKISLDDVMQIQAKKGSGHTWGLVAGGSCLALSFISVLATDPDAYEEENGEEFNKGEMMAGSVLWGALLYGVGYLLGSISDDWNIVYINS